MNKEAKLTDADFWRRKEPIYLAPSEVCDYIKICPFKQLNCFGGEPHRDWSFICDIQKLKEMHYRLEFFR